MQAKTSGVAKSVEDGSIWRQSSHRLAIVALVEVEAGFLSFGQMDLVAHPALFDRDWLAGHTAPDGPVLQFQSFKLADAALGSQIYALGAKPLHEQFNKHVSPLGQTQRSELHDEPAVIAVHGQTGETIAFAEHEPAGSATAIQIENGTAEVQCGVQKAAEEVFIERLFLDPAIETNAHLALTVEVLASDAMTTVRIEIDNISIPRLSFNRCNRSRVNPGMSAIEGA